MWGYCAIHHGTTFHDSIFIAEHTGPTTLFSVTRFDIEDLLIRFPKILYVHENWGFDLIIGYLMWQVINLYKKSLCNWCSTCIARAILLVPKESIHMPPFYRNLNMSSQLGKHMITIVINMYFLNLQFACNTCISNPMILDISML